MEACFDDLILGTGRSLCVCERRDVRLGFLPQRNRHHFHAEPANPDDLDSQGAGMGPCSRSRMASVLGMRRDNHSQAIARGLN